MKKTKIIVVIILILVLIAAIWVYKGTTTYSANGVSFNYPSNWKANYSFNSGIKTAEVYDPSNKWPQTTYVTVYKRNSNVNLRDYYNSVKIDKTSSNYRLISEKNTTIDGTTAYVATYSDSDVYKGVIAVLEKKGNIYLIKCNTPAENFDQEQDNFNTVINSFKVL